MRHRTITTQRNAMQRLKMIYSFPEWSLVDSLTKSIRWFNWFRSLWNGGQSVWTKVAVYSFVDTTNRKTHNSFMCNYWIKSTNFILFRWAGYWLYTHKMSTTYLLRGIFSFFQLFFIEVLLYLLNQNFFLL